MLLDTHAYLWWLAGDERMSVAAREAVADPDAIVFVSAATVWEMAIKTALGRLHTGGADLVDEIAGSGFSELPITPRHAWSAGTLPPHHRDPFDRMLVAQATQEGLRCVTRDTAFAAYEVETLW